MQSRADIGFARSFEFGYKGLLGDKLSVAVDFYTYSRTGFTNYQSISPTYALLGADPATDLTANAAAQLTSFFSTNAEGQAAIQALTIGLVAPNFGIDPTDIVAVGTALQTNPVFAATVAGTQPAVLSQTVATVAAGLLLQEQHLMTMPLHYIQCLV